MEVIANCIGQMGALSTAEPLTDGYTVQAQSANDNKWLVSFKWEP